MKWKGPCARASAIPTAVAAASLGAPVQRLVDQISPTTYQSFLTSLPTHNGDTPGFDVGRSRSVVR